MSSRRLRDLSRAVDNVLVAYHGLKHALPEDHPPFEGEDETGVGHEQRYKAATAVALDRYGPGSMFDLWCACRAIEQLKTVWADENE